MQGSKGREKGKGEREERNGEEEGREGSFLHVNKSHADTSSFR